MKPDDAELASARWQAWRMTWKILHDKTLSAREQIKRCDEVYSGHASAWADLEIYHAEHPIRIMRENMIKELPAMIKRANAGRKEREQGQIGML